MKVDSFWECLPKRRVSDHFAYPKENKTRFIETYIPANRAGTQK